MYDMTVPFCCFFFGYKKKVVGGSDVICMRMYTVTYIHPRETNDRIINYGTILRTYMDIMFMNVTVITFLTNIIERRTDKLCFELHIINSVEYQSILNLLAVFIDRIVVYMNVRYLFIYYRLKLFFYRDILMVYVG